MKLSNGKQYYIYGKDIKLPDFVAMLFMVYIVFEGAIRYFFFENGVPHFSYALKMIMLLTILLSYRHFQSNRNKVFFLFYTVLIINGVYINGISDAMLAFVVFIPFVFFFYFNVALFLDGLKTSFLSVLFILVSAGLFFDYYYELPWLGLTAFVDGVEIETSRLWWVDGEKRLSGFGRSSFETAIVLAFLALLIILKTKSMFLRCSVVVACAYSIDMTTTKGAFFAFICSVLFYCLPRKNLLREAFFAIVLLVGNLLLFLSLFDVDVEFLVSIYFSLYERIVFMWPAAIELLSENGNFFGLGLGGVGVALTKSYNEWGAVDNFWLYLYCTSGFLIGLVLLLLAFLNINGIANNRYSVIFVFFFIYGFTTNVVESAFGQLIFALFLNSLLLKRGSRDNIVK